MNPARALWAAVEGDPVFMRRLHGWLTLAWTLAIPVSIIWRDSVVWVVCLSHYAIITGHWSSWQAARVEVKQDAAVPEKHKIRRPARARRDRRLAR